MQLSKEDLKALRNADSVVFMFKDDRHYIDAIKQRENSKDGYEGRVSIAVDGSVYAGYGDGNWTPKYGVAHVSSCKYDANWMTVINLLHENDELRLKWVADNNNQHVTDANLHHDELHLIVRRGNKSMQFKVADSVGVSNSARMLRSNSWG